MPAMIISEGQIIREYQIAASGSASTAQKLSLPTDPLTANAVQQARLLVEARGTNIVFCFGTSSVASSITVTNNVLPDGNFSVPSGAIYAIDINGATQNYVSVFAETSSGTACIRVCSVPTWRTY